MSRSSRRNLLKGIALSFPAAWSAPVVQSVILPAHAQTSGGDNGSEPVPENGPEPVPENGIFSFGSPLLDRSLLNWFVPTAHATSHCDPEVGCATLQDGVLTILVAYDRCCCYSGSGNLDGGSISLSSPDNLCGCGPYTAELMELTGSLGARNLKLSIDGKTLDFIEEVAGNCDCAALL
jgi:hypothetical protein